MKNVYIKPITLLVAAMLVIFSLQAQTGKATTSQVQVNPQALNFILMGDWGRVRPITRKKWPHKWARPPKPPTWILSLPRVTIFIRKGSSANLTRCGGIPLKEIYTAFSLQRDWHPVLGNHDYGSNPDAQVAYSKISRRWRPCLRAITPRYSILAATPHSKRLFVFIDTTPLIKGYYKGDGHKVHDQDSTAQVKWVEQTLAKASPNVKWKFVVGHHPMYTGGSRTEGNDTRAIRRMLEPVFRKI